VRKEEFRARLAQTGADPITENRIARKMLLRKSALEQSGKSIESKARIESVGAAAQR
jgi:hypothetical protein